MSGTTKQLEALVAIGKTITASLDIGEVLRQIMEQLGQLFPPGDWSLLLADPERGGLQFEIVVGEAAEQLLGQRVARGEGIAGWVAQHQQPLLITDVQRDGRFARRFDDLTALDTRSILAAPLVCQQQTLGVIELISRAGDPSFTQAQLELLLPFADFAAVALANARNHEQVQQLTVMDECTGLYNSRHLHQALEQEISRHRRHGSPVSLIFFDLDHFKQVNDTHGHQIGTRLLAEVGKLLKDSLRELDVAVRYGGDEFVILLPETSRNGGRVVAHRIWRAIREHAFLAGDGLDLRLSASVGCASCPENARDGFTLILAADTAMYKAKEWGRDQVAVAHREIDEWNHEIRPSAAAGCEPGMLRPV